VIEARVEALNPEMELPKPEKARPEPRPELALRDLRIRLMMIPMFGIAVPLLTGLFGTLGPGEGTYWLGLLWFTALSFLIWQGNRWVLLAQRRRLDWFEQPIRKIILLVLANIFYTAPLSTGMLWAWYRALGVPPDWSAIRAATLMSVICVLFITHVYETVYLIQQRESDLVRVEQIERARAEAELEALKAQVDPHFLFNSLNTLSWLIEHDAAQARRFNENLAEVYRYILHNKARELVMAEEELAFLTRYCELLRLRFGEAVEWELPAAGELEGLLVPPISLQILAENAVKHNELSRERPLRIRLVKEETGLTMSNERRPRASVRESGRIGLRNLDERCRLILGRGIAVKEAGGEFRVTMPVERLA
jgi:hypothetical protein